MDRAAIRNIEWDCSQLLIKFYNLLDQKRYQEMAALFTANGVWVRLGKELVGPQRMLDEMNERDDWLTTHLVSNIQVTVLDETRAEMMQYVVQYRAENYDPSSGRHRSFLRLECCVIAINSSATLARGSSSVRRVAPYS